MKIAHLFYNLNIGGSETMVVDIMNNQVKYEDITLIVINKENDPHLLQSIDPRIKKYIIGRTTGSKNPYPFFLLNKLLYYLKPNVVHIHNYNIMPVLIKQKNTRYFFTAHTNGIDIMQPNRFDKIFAISKYVAQDIRQRYTVPTELIYNGINTSEIIYKHQPEKNENFRIVQIGRQFIQQKGQDILLKALHILIYKKQITNLSLDLIGCGPDTEYLQQLSKELQIEKHVTFLGARNRAFIYQHLHEYQLAVQPSRQEGFGLTVAEAICAGVPVLLSDIKGPMEIIDNGKFGTTFEVDNIDMCAEKIATIIQNYPEYIQKTYPAREFVFQNFDIVTTSLNYIKAYQNS